MKPRAKAIPVPPEAVRQQAAILEGLLVTVTSSGAIVWIPCWNCGGSGNYPSSMTPPGRCRLYCWAVSTGDPFNPYRSKRADDPTFGKLAVSVAKYVKKAQASDRAAYRAQVRAVEFTRQRDARLTGTLDPRIVAVAAFFKLDVLNLPVVDLAPGDTHYAYIDGRQVSKHVFTAVDLINRWTATGALTDAQWSLLTNLPQWEREREQRAAARAEAKKVSQWVGEIGARLNLELRVESVKDVETTSYGWSQAIRHVDLIKLRDTQGNLFVWWNDRVRTPAVGDTITMRATVKKHEEYQGERQTTLQRVTLPKEVVQ